MFTCYKCGCRKNDKRLVEVKLKRDGKDEFIFNLCSTCNKSLLNMLEKNFVITMDWNYIKKNYF